LRVYGDSSALIKRSLQEPESEAVEDFIEEVLHDGGVLVSSSLAWVEVNRAIRVRRESFPPGDWMRFERACLSGVGELPLDGSTLSLARRVGSPLLRTLDAIHLAAAIGADVDVLLTYDARLAEVAREMGIEIRSPAPV
jgi:uncharacterized protein